MDFVQVEAGRIAKPPIQLFEPLTAFEADYNISATFCTPNYPKNGKEKTVLLASHGLTYSREYVHDPLHMRGY